jgi:hypothetical protein
MSQRSSCVVRILSLLILGLTAFAHQASGATVEETLAALNAKPAEERQKILVENARKEGQRYFLRGNQFARYPGNRHRL